MYCYYGEIDMYNFLINLLLVFIGAFLAFISAIFVNFITKKKSEKILEEKIKNRLVKEMESIKNELEKSSSDNGIYFRYNYPVWKMCVNSGYLFSLSGDKVYSEFEKIYLLIESANNIEKEYYNLALRLFTDRNLLNEFNEKRKERRKDLQKNIANVLENLKE